MKWLKQALTDSHGVYDVAYISLFAISLSILGTVPFLCIAAWISYSRCVPVVSERLPLVTCSFNPEPLGIAIGAIAAGFATALGALAGYMAATRPRKPADGE